MIFVCSATHKTKSMFFFLAQTEQGDIFKVTLETDEEMVSRPWPGQRCLAAPRSSQPSRSQPHVSVFSSQGDGNPAEIL